MRKRLSGPTDGSLAGGRHRHRSSYAGLALAGACMLVTGCTVNLVSDYDEQIDSGLSQVNTDVDSFINKMVAESGTPAGTWDSNKDFYFDEEAKVDTLILREKAHRVLKSCVPVSAASSAMSAFYPPGDIAKVNAAISQAGLTNDDCSVFQLELVKTGIVNLEKLHQANGAKGITAFDQGPLGTGVEGPIGVAITVELAKKKSQSSASMGGS